MTEHVTQLLDRYYDGELSTGKRTRVERHLETCAECRAALDELERLSTRLHESPPAPTLTPPDRFVAQVRLRLPDRQPMTERRWVKIGGVAFPMVLVGAWIFVQVIWLFITAALVVVELGGGRELGVAVHTRYRTAPAPLGGMAEWPRTAVGPHATRRYCALADLLAASDDGRHRCPLRALADGTVSLAVGTYVTLEVDCISV